MIKEVCRVEFKNGSKEELLPGMTPDFPYIASYFDLDRQTIGPFAPWHWHNEVEMFYIESGTLEYHIPKGTVTFPAGSGGILNSNVLHMTTAQKGAVHTVQLLHIFDTSFIGGQRGSRIEQNYILPFTASSRPGIFALDPGTPEHTEILGLLRDSFEISSGEYAYELKLRSALSEIWYRMLALCSPLLDGKANDDTANDTLKSMIIYIHEHFPGKVSVADICSASFVSERECFRTFRECLHTTPVEYLKNYRLQQACRMLAEGREPVTLISQACGLGSSSYFGKVFRERMGCSPLEYRRRWQNIDMKGQI